MELRVLVLVSLAAVARPAFEQIARQIVLPCWLLAGLLVVAAALEALRVLAWLVVAWQPAAQALEMVVAVEVMTCPGGHRVLGAYGPRYPGSIPLAG